MNDTNSLLHMRWNCKYHIVFTPKYRMKIIYVDTAEKNAKKIQEYIKNQLKEDQIHDQKTMKEYIDPFTGGK